MFQSQEIQQGSSPGWQMILEVSHFETFRTTSAQFSIKEKEEGKEKRWRRKKRRRGRKERKGRRKRRKGKGREGKKRKREGVKKSKAKKRKGKLFPGFLESWHGTW